MIERDDAVVLGERAIAREEVEVGRRRPPVQQEHRGCAGRAGDVTDVDRAQFGQIELDPGWESRFGQCRGPERQVGGVAQTVSTFRTVTVSDPFGAS